MLFLSPRHVLASFSVLKIKCLLTYALLLFTYSSLVDAVLPVMAKHADIETLELVSIQAFHFYSICIVRNIYLGLFFLLDYVFLYVFSCNITKVKNFRIVLLY